MEFEMGYFIPPVYPYIEGGEYLCTDEVEFTRDWRITHYPDGSYVVEAEVLRVGWGKYAWVEDVLVKERPNVVYYSN